MPRAMAEYDDTGYPDDLPDTPGHHFFGCLVADDRASPGPRVRPIGLRVAHLLSILRRKIRRLEPFDAPVLIWRRGNVLMPLLLPPVRDSFACAACPLLEIAPAPFPGWIGRVNRIVPDVRVHVPRL